MVRTAWVATSTTGDSARFRNRLVARSSDTLRLQWNRRRNCWMIWRLSRRRYFLRSGSKSLADAMLSGAHRHFPIPTLN